MISVAEALRTVLEATPLLSVEEVALGALAGRVVAEPVTSTRAVPGADNSAMDGFAVRAADVVEAGARLRVVGRVPAGSVRSEPLVRGTAVEIYTGSVVPPGADTVVRVEDTERDGETVVVTTAIARAANVRRAGEDVAPGDTVLAPGTVLGAADVGVLASIGCTTVRVHRRPRVAIVSTGAELVGVDETPGPGQIVNSNAHALAVAVGEAGAESVVLPPVGDRFEDIRAQLSEAAACDVVLSTGGVSVGDFDFVKEALDALGVERAFWKVAQKPGRPLTFGRRGDHLFFGLPGNPVSALVCFYVYVWPVLRGMQGHGARHLPTAEATLAGPIRKRAGLTEFVRVQLAMGDGGLTATPAASQSSGVLSAMTAGAGLLIAPAGRGEIEAGERLTVIVPAALALATADPAPALGTDSPASAEHDNS